MTPLSEINEARREAAEKLEAVRLSQFSDRNPLDETLVFTLPPLKKTLHAKQPLLSVNVDSVEKVKAALKNGADIIMFGAENYEGEIIKKEDYQNALDLARQRGKKIIFSTPQIINAKQMSEISKTINYFSEIRPDAISAGNIGTIYLLKQLTDLPIHGDYPLNIYNSMTVEALSELGLKSLTLSPELNFTQLKDIRDRTDMFLESLVHGRLPLMVSEYCVTGSFLTDCAKTGDKKRCSRNMFWLKDRSGEKFPVVTDQYCRMYVLNAKETSMLPNVSKLSQSGVDAIRIEGKYMDTETFGKVTQKYIKFLDNNYDNKNAEVFEEVDGVTRGHYFRGVID
jgi:putative protease